MRRCQLKGNETIKADFLTEARIFRKAIVEVKGSIDIHDRMHSFPLGCCDDATDLFAHYIFQKYGIKTTRVDGSYYDVNKENNDWHTWLEINRIIYDLTADNYYPIYKDIYVGKCDEFHRRYSKKHKVYRGFEDLGSDCRGRMQGLYDLIIDRFRQL